MEIVLKDRDGNDILSPTLTQWDQGVTIQIRDFYYSTSEWQYAYLHFYNSTKREIYAQIPTRTYTTLTAEIPNQLLREPYPITAHVYVASGEVATNPDAKVEARTVFTATIGVEPRMQPDDFEPVDNAGQASAAQVQQNLRDQIAAWETTLIGLYGTVSATPVEGYFDTETQTMYSDSAKTQELTGNQDTIYVDNISGKLYTFSNGVWTAWDGSVVDTMRYCKARADACDNASASMHAQYQGELQTMNATIQNTFSDALDGCVVRIATSAPTATSYENETRPVVTFVIGA